MNGKMVLPKMEIGHMTININGEKCTCGRFGCFETLASMKKLKDDIKEKLKLDSETTGKEIRELLEDINTYNKVKHILDEYIHNLSEGLKNIINIFNPETISIGGSFAHYKDILLDKLIKEISGEESLFIKKNIPKIVIATLKNEAGIIGATIRESRGA